MKTLIWCIVLKGEIWNIWSMWLEWVKEERLREFFKVVHDVRKQ
jgi:hypothetical protein